MGWCGAMRGIHCCLKAPQPHLINKYAWKSFWQHLYAHYGQHHVITTKNNSKLSLKISAFRLPPRTGNRMMCNMERHPLPLEYFITFPRYIRMLGRASDSIHNTIIVNIVLLLPNIPSQISCKISPNGPNLCTCNGMMYGNERHTLLLKCFTTFPGYIRMIGGASDSIYKHIMVNTISLLPKITLNFHWKYQHLISLSAQKIGCCAARRGMHCWLKSS